MKRRLTLMMIALHSSGCHRSPTAAAESYRRWSDRMIVRLGLEQVGISPCRVRHEVINRRQFNLPPEVDECYKLQPSRRWRGTWVTEFEAHRFCPGATQACAWDKQPRYELWWNTRVFTSRPQIGAQLQRVYAVDFVGRRTEYPIGSWNQHYEVVVDRLVAMKDLGALPKQ